MAIVMLLKYADDPPSYSHTVQFELDGIIVAYLRFHKEGKFSVATIVLAQGGKLNFHNCCYGKKIVVSQLKGVVQVSLL